MKRIESLLKIAGMKLELQTRFCKGQVSFQVVKTVKCKGGFIQNATANAVCGVGLSKTN